ncbi:MAG: nitroreductase family protein [Desulfovibrio sp.]|nr:nitroreductase family protein [Desulfovibrio sp.]
MDAITTIKTRRSVRSFTDQAIASNLIEELLACGMQAPSAGNAQPWEFVVLTEKSLLQKVTTITPYAPFAPTAACGIVVCCNQSLEKHPGFWIEDTSACAQNILLAAHAMGLGGVWIGIYPLEERVAGLRAIIHAPETIIPMGLLLIGYPEKTPEPVDRYKKERVHANTFGTPFVR